MTTAYLAAVGFESTLEEELRRADTAVQRVHGSLFICAGDAVAASWAANTWFDVEETQIASIGDGAKQLRARQRSWAVYAPEHRGRARLITDRLPPLSSRPLQLGQEASHSPLGSWTLLKPDLMLLSERCSSSFPNGGMPLQEFRVGPPSRAYLKLWEAFVILGRFPEPGDLAIDLGACPGGWTWLLAQLGCHVVAVDKAPLDPAVSAIDHVESVQTSAFALEPGQVRGGKIPQWVCADIACYPERLLLLVERWSTLRPAPALIFTLKFQGDTDHEVADRFKTIPNSRLVHLSHNKHELTLIVQGNTVHDDRTPDGSGGV